MMQWLQDPLELVRFVSTAATAIFGVLAVVGDKNTERGRITAWGWAAIAGVCISTATALGSQMIAHRQEVKMSIAAETQRSENLAMQDQLLEDTRKTMEVQALTLHHLESVLKQTRESLDRQTDLANRTRDIAGDLGTVTRSQQASLQQQRDVLANTNRILNPFDWTIADVGLTFDLKSRELHPYGELLRRHAASRVDTLPADPGTDGETRIHEYSDDDVSIAWHWRSATSQYELDSMVIREESRLFPVSGGELVGFVPPLTSIALFGGLRRSDISRHDDRTLDACDSGDVQFEIAAWNSHASNSPSTAVDQVKARAARILLKVDFSTQRLTQLVFGAPVAKLRDNGLLPSIHDLDEATICMGLLGSIWAVPEVSLFRIGLGVNGRRQMQFDGWERSGYASRSHHKVLKRELAGM